MFGDLLILVLGITDAAKDSKVTYQGIYQAISGSENLNLRRSRSVLGITSPVLKSLIKTATEIPTTSDRFRKFVKHGQAGDAIVDFYKLRPTKLKVTSEPESTRGSASGFVDDTDVQLRIRKRWPTILIYSKDVGPIRIVYVKP